MKVNQRQIAAELGISQTAVSMVVNNPTTAKVSGEKRHRILEYLRQTNYLLYHHGGKTWNIGYLLESSMDINDPFYNRFFNGIVRGAEDAEYSVIVEPLRDTATKLLSRSKVDGLIIETTPDALERASVPLDIPVVMLNNCASENHYDAVMPDNAGGMFQAIKYLHDCGHHHIAYLGLRPPHYRYYANIAERLNAFRNAFEFYFATSQHDAYISTKNVAASNAVSTEAAIASALSDWMKLPEPPTAVVCHNDYYALTLLKIATAAGLRIPEDLSVIGTDNTAKCEYSIPPLTSVDHNGTAMGRLAVELLVKRIQDPSRETVRMSCNSQLVIRNSTGPVTRRSNHNHQE